MNHFNQDFHRMQRNHNRLQKFVIWFIAFVFVLIISWFIFIGVVFYTAGKEINKSGLSGVVEQIWCGERKDCKLIK